jgi:hypothetical protein
MIGNTFEKIFKKYYSFYNYHAIMKKTVNDVITYRINEYKIDKSLNVLLVSLTSE